MIFFLVVVGVLIISIVVAVLVKDNTNFECIIKIVSMIIVVIAVLIILLSIINIFFENNPSYQEKYKREWMLKREAIIWQMENGYMSGDLAEYNKEIYSMQWTHKNPWFNWYRGKYVMDLEMIDVDDFKRRER